MSMISAQNIKIGYNKIGVEDQFDCYCLKLPPCYYYLLKGSIRESGSSANATGADVTVSLVVLSPVFVP